MGYQSSLWNELKPILGPLIQAAVVLIVGAWTIWFQLRQARTAERKLFADLHDKRYAALRCFTHDLLEMALAALEEDDTLPPRSVLDEQARRRGLATQLDQLTWLFGSDVIFYLSQMQEHAEAILGTVNRLRHNLDSDDKAQLIESLNLNHSALHGALGRVNDAARYYLYVGNITTEAPALPAFTSEQLKAHTAPRRKR